MKWKGFAFLWMAAATWTLQAQQPASQNGQTPLTPEQQVEQQIRQVDPLDQSDKELKQRDKNDQDADKKSQQDQKPTPGSLAAEELANAARQGPRVSEDESAEGATQDYSGPAVLSRSYSVNRPMIPTELKWVESVGFSFVDNLGVASFVNSSGMASNADLRGATLNWSLAGRHYFRHDQLGVNYTGNYSDYPGNGGYTGLNQMIGVDYSHVFTRRLTLNLTGSGSMLSQNYTLGGEYVSPETTVANINLSSSPNIQITDYRTRQFTTQVDIVWQRSARMSFDGGVSYFAIARDTPSGYSQTTTGTFPGLLGMTGQQAHGDMNYRLTRKLTVGTYYSFSSYLYPQDWGTSHFSTIGGVYSYAVTRTLQVRLRAGASMIHSRDLTETTFPAAIAALLGQTGGLIDVTSSSVTSDISGQVIKDFHRGKTVNVSFAHGVSPGNGYYQTSVQESISAGFGMELFRRYMIQATAGRDTLSAVSQALGQYESIFGTFSVSHRLGQGVSANFSATIRHFDLTQFIGLRTQVLLSAGMNWGSTNGRLWPF